MRLRGSVKAVVIQRGYWLVVKKRDYRGMYYSFPGGGQTPGETLVQTVQREMIEA